MPFALRAQPRHPRASRRRLGAEAGEDVAARVALAERVKAAAIEVVGLQRQLDGLSDPATNGPEVRARALAAAEGAQRDAVEFLACRTELEAAVAAREARVRELTRRLQGLTGRRTLGAWEARLDADVPWVLTRAEYDQTRTKFHAVTGWPRDDRLLPKLVPPGATLVVANPTRPDLDLVVPPGYEAGFGPDGPVVTRSAWVDVPAPTGAPTPAEIDEVRRLLASWGYPNLDDAAVARVGESQLREVVARRDKGTRRVWAVVDERPYDPTWWYATPWGQEKVVFVPPAVRGQYGWEASVAAPLPEDGALVGVEHPHPYVVGQPAPLRTYEEDNPSFGGARTYGVYRPPTVPGQLPPVILTGRGDRQGPRWWGGEGSSGGMWGGSYSDAERGEWWHEALATVARSAALNALTTAVFSVLTLGGGAPLVQAAFQVVARSAVGDTAAGRALDAAVQAKFDAGARVLAPDSPGQVVTDLFAPVQPVAADSPIQAVVAGAPAVVAAAGAPAKANAVLAEAALASAYLDATGPFGQLLGLAFRELTIRAHAAEAEAAALRRQLAERQAELQGQAWFRAVQAAATALTAVALVASGAAVFGALLQTATSAAQAALTLVDAQEQLKLQRQDLEAAVAGQVAEYERAAAEIEAQLAEAERAAAARKRKKSTGGLVAAAIVGGLALAVLRR